ncbi:MAG: hypothetical protein A2176_03420 [Spirochaetes bacterium RBG_13_51_14]|nr:MAG: hypothetical protein A2176_03420 [Spirochaetes bacterium RBG_13_51_14]
MNIKFKEKKMTKVLLLKIFLIVIGGIFLMFFIYLFGKNILFLRSCVQTKGFVHTIARSRNDYNQFTPVIKFSTSTVEEFTFSPDSSSTNPRYKVGQEVSVLYDPDFPEDAHIKSFFALWIGPIVLFIVAGLLLGLGIGIPPEQTSAAVQIPVPHVKKELVTFSDKMQYYWPKYVIPGGFILFGLITIGMGIADVKNMVSSKSWPTAKGIVMKSEVQSSGQYFYPEITYVFHVKKKKYESSNFDLSNTQSGDPLPSKRAVKRYPAGKEVTVYYNPTNPEECALEPGFEWSVLVMMFGGGAAFLFFAWMVIMALRIGLIKT